VYFNVVLEITDSNIWHLKSGHIYVFAESAFVTAETKLKVEACHIDFEACHIHIFQV